MNVFQHSETINQLNYLNIYLNFILRKTEPLNLNKKRWWDNYAGPIISILSLVSALAFNYISNPKAIKNQELITCSGFPLKENDYPLFTDGLNNKVNSHLQKLNYHY